MNYRKTLKLRVAAISQAGPESRNKLLMGRRSANVFKIGLEKIFSEGESNYFDFLQDTFSILSLEHPKIGDIFTIQVISENKE